MTQAPPCATASCRSRPIDPPSGWVASLPRTKGSVVYRDDVIELIQYAPTTPQVHVRPLVVVPPPIGRFCLLDLQPGRGFVEHAVGRGLQVFMISWRNPTRGHAHWDLDPCAERMHRAVAVAPEISCSGDVNTMGFCAGGIIQTLLRHHLAAVGDRSVHSAGYAVALLDFDAPAALGAFSPRASLASPGGSRAAAG